MTAARTADDFRRLWPIHAFPQTAPYEQTASCTASFEDPNGWREDRSGGESSDRPPWVVTTAMGIRGLHQTQNGHISAAQRRRRTHRDARWAQLFKVGGYPATCSTRRPERFPGGRRRLPGDPALLLRSGIGGPAVGAELRLHPTSLVTGIYAEPQDEWSGPAMAGIMNEFAEVNDGFGYLIECVQHLPALFSSFTPWLSGAQHKELTRKFQYRADWLFLAKDRGAGSVTIDENGQSIRWYPFTDELDRRHLREGAVTAIRMQEAAGAEQIFVAGQPFAPWNRGEDLEAFIEKANQIPIGPGGISVFSAHQMCSAKLGSDPHTSVAKPNGELHDTTGVCIADAIGMPSCSGVNPMVTTMALARRTAMNMLNEG